MTYRNDGGEEVTLTAVCGGTDQGDVSRGAASAADFQSARQALPWVGEEELALTNISYIIVGAEADLSEALGLILSDHEMSPSATVWLTQDAGALLDACEVTRDEGMLQEVLDVVGRNLDRLAVSAESVKLLAYCYYYVEEEECVERAGRMLEELRKMGRGEEELADAETILEELT